MGSRALAQQDLQEQVIEEQKLSESVAVAVTKAKALSGPELRKANEILGARADEVQVFMITVDPERDTPEIVAEFLAHFDPSFIGLIGTQDQVAQIATQYGVFYQKQDTTSVMGYLVDHTATVMLVDQDGYVRLIFPYGAPGEEIAEDITYILDH